MIARLVIHVLGIANRMETIGLASRSESEERFEFPLRKIGALPALRRSARIWQEAPAAEIVKALAISGLPQINRPEERPF
jgi:hypothetical protein